MTASDMHRPHPSDEPPRDDPPPPPRASGRARAVAGTVRQTFWLIVLAALLLYAFYVVIGGVNVADAIGWTVAAVVLLALYALHSWSNSRRMVETHDPRRYHDRERRGF